MAKNLLLFALCAGMVLNAVEKIQDKPAKVLAVGQDDLRLKVFKDAGINSQYMRTSEGDLIKVGPQEVDLLPRIVADAREYVADKMKKGIPFPAQYLPKKARYEHARLVAEKAARIVSSVPVSPASNPGYNYRFVQGSAVNINELVCQANWEKYRQSVKASKMYRFQAACQSAKEFVVGAASGVKNTASKAYHAFLGSKKAHYALAAGVCVVAAYGLYKIAKSAVADAELKFLVKQILISGKLEDQKHLKEMFDSLGYDFQDRDSLMAFVSRCIDLRDEFYAGCTEEDFMNIILSISHVVSGVYWVDGEWVTSGEDQDIEDTVVTFLENSNLDA